MLILSYHSRVGKINLKAFAVSNRMAKENVIPDELCYHRFMTRYKQQSYHFPPIGVSSITPKSLTNEDRTSSGLRSGGGGRRSRVDRYHHRRSCGGRGGGLLLVLVVAVRVDGLGADHWRRRRDADSNPPKMVRASD